MRTIALAAAGIAAIGLASCAKPEFKEYAYPALNFAATFQAPPKVTATPASKDGSTPASTMVEANADGLDFAVNVTDASNATESTDDMLQSAPDAVAESLGMDVGPRTYAAVGLINGREVRFDKDGKPVMRMRFFFAGNNFYEVSADSASKGPDDPRIEAFLNSFHMLQGPGAAKTRSAPPAVNAVAASSAAPAANTPSP